LGANHAPSCVLWWSVKTPRQELRGVIQANRGGRVEGPRRPGASSWVEPEVGRSRVPSNGIGGVLQHSGGRRSRPRGSCTRRVQNAQRRQDVSPASNVVGNSGRLASSTLHDYPGVIISCAALPRQVRFQCGSPPFARVHRERASGGTPAVRRVSAAPPLLATRAVFPVEVNHKTRHRLGMSKDLRYVVVSHRVRLVAEQFTAARSRDSGGARACAVEAFAGRREYRSAP
jgi:hypothetical protein